MAWYRAGSVTVTNGSAVVTGANTDFVSNTQQGEAFLGPDGRTYEIATIISATQIFLTTIYQGPTAGAADFVIMPTSSFARDLALGAAELLNTFAAVRDGIGAGLIPDGVVATPALRFSADQDTGIYRGGANQLAFGAGGVEVANATPAAFTVLQSLSTANGAVISSGVSNVLDVYANVAGAAIIKMRFGSAGNPFATNSYIEAQTLTGTASDLRLGTSGAERLRIDSAGNMLIGRSEPANYHRINKDVPQGSVIMEVARYGNAGLTIYSSAGAGASSAATTIQVGSNTATNRSINSAGTINASGADYAEYMTKAASCGNIAAGDVCGVDIEGKLTRQWAAAISFVVKSTDPSLVGGDVWAAHLSPKPDAPGAEPTAPGEAPTMPDDDAPEALATWRDMALAHAALVNAYPAEHAAWVSDQASYKIALEAWEDALETARQCVDRIAFCGQVPVNVTGGFAVGDYIIAVANGSGIKAVAVAETDITFEQYRRRIGKVWAVREGRAWIDVQHG